MVVLIVAKCIVNQTDGLMTNDGIDVLIVAKCIVNTLKEAYEIMQKTY